MFQQLKFESAHLSRQTNGRCSVLKMKAQQWLIQPNIDSELFMVKLLNVNMYREIEKEIARNNIERIGNNNNQ